MIPQPLNRPFIGIKITREDYRKVKGILPTPSYIDILHSINSKSIILVYVIEGYISSPSQFRWISNIKLGLQKFLCVDFVFEDEFFITESTEITNNIYAINELSKAFKAPLITYPKIMYPITKKELYKHLCWYGKRLIHQKCFTKEAMITAALLMNKRLDGRYQNKELHKKALGAYIFIDENREKFNIRLDEKQLKEAHSKGGRIRKAKQTQKTKERIEQFLKHGNFLKTNGKVNISLIARSLNMNRKTVAKYVGKKGGYSNIENQPSDGPHNNVPIL